MSTPLSIPVMRTLFCAHLATLEPLPVTSEEVQAALCTALDQARSFSVGTDLDTDHPKFDAVLSCLHILSRLDLSVLEAHLLLSFARQPDRTLGNLASELMMTEDKITTATAQLFQRGLVMIPFGGIVKLTERGLNDAKLIIACTALAEASNSMRWLDAKRKAELQASNS